MDSREGQAVPKNGGKLSPEQESYRQKYLLLKRKCGSMESDNKKLLNRIYQVRKTISRLSRERRGLVKKLNELKDSHKGIERVIPLEDDPLMHLLGFHDPNSLHGSKVKPAIDPRTGFPHLAEAKVNSKLAAAPRERSVASATPRKRKARDGIKLEREKDPRAPKKPANAFLMFCQEKRHTTFHPLDPDKSKLESHADITRQLAKEWNDLGGIEKKRYFTAYEKEKVKYVKRVQQYSKDLKREVSRAVNIPPVPSTASPTPKEPAAKVSQDSSGTPSQGGDEEMTRIPQQTGPMAMEVISTTAVERKNKPEVDPYSFDGD